jgi:hypothetical protein
MTSCFLLSAVSALPADGQRTRGGVYACNVAPAETGCLTDSPRARACVGGFRYTEIRAYLSTTTRRSSDHLLLSCLPVLLDDATLDPWCR